MWERLKHNSVVYAECIEGFNSTYRSFLSTSYLQEGKLFLGALTIYAMATRQNFFPVPVGKVAKSFMEQFPDMLGPTDLEIFKDTLEDNVGMGTTLTDAKNRVHVLREIAVFSRLRIANNFEEGSVEKAIMVEECDMLRHQVDLAGHMLVGDVEYVRNILGQELQRRYQLPRK
jgi:hypothetical protein